MLEGIEFKDVAAGYALEVLLELFLHKPSRIGGVEQMVIRARYIAEEMEKKKTDSNVTNFLAVKAMKGIIIGNYKNLYEGYNMSGLDVEIEDLVQKCYKIASMMAGKTGPATQRA